MSHFFATKSDTDRRATKSDTLGHCLKELISTESLIARRCRAIRPDSTNPAARKLRALPPRRSVMTMRHSRTGGLLGRVDNAL